MAEKQLPFIDIAVHPGVRDRFAAGQAVILFDIAMNRVLWSNGEAAALFGNGLIYDLIEDGPDRSDVAFRQLAASAEQLTETGQKRSLVIRMASGFSRIAVQAELERIDLGSGLQAILLAAPPARKVTGRAALAGRMLSGFDDPDTHMAVLDGNGTVLAASADFGRTGLTPDLIAPLVASVRRSPDRLVKRPILTGLGYLPAALGMLSDDPETHLLFCVETSLGRMDPPEPVTPAAIQTLTEAAPDLTVEPATETGLELTGTSLAEARIEAVQDETRELQAEQEDMADLPDRDVVVAETGPTLTNDSVVDEVGSQPGSDITLVQPAEDDDDMAQPMWEPEVPGAIDEQLEALSQDTAALADDADQTEPDQSLADAASMPDETVAPVEPEAVTVTEEPAPALEDIRPDFRFNGAGRPVRFVWKIDTNGIFSEISEEFAATVGPHAAAVSGLAFNDLAALFNLDPDGKVGELLSRRDTWSGRTIHWPVEGTALSVPIDLAALPTYSRAREFDGFRGFGIIRVGDARPDPLAMGLTLAQTSPAMLTGLETAPDDAAGEQTTLVSGTIDTMSGPEITEDTITLADTGLAIDGTAEAVNTESADDIELTVDDQFADLDNPDAPREDDSDFRGEKPALKFAMTPGRRLSDKIIQLEERRARRNEGLTTGEQAAFREIARQLEPFGKRPNETLFKDKDGQDPADDDTNPVADDLTQPPVATEDQSGILPADDSADAPREPEIAQLIEPDAADPVMTDEDRATLTDEPVEADTEIDASADDVLSDFAGEPEQTPNQPAPQPESENDADDETLADVPALPVLPRRASGDSLSAGLVDQLPVAILIHAGDRLIHANPEFFRLTGYADLDQLDAAGGLDGLITRLEGEDSASQGAVFLVREDNEVLPVTARLQSVRFDNQTALLLAVNPVSHPAAQVAPVATPVVAVEASEGEDTRSLRVEVEELRAILETATDGVVLVTAEGEIRSLNRSASALFNYDREETAGKPFAMLFAHESQKAVMDYLGGLSGHGVASVLNDGREVIGREATGGFIPLFMTMGKLSSGGYCAVIRDITQWKRSEEELRNAKRAAETANAHKSEFLARVSHEIRTPLNAIIGFSDMMSSERFGPIGHQRYVEYSNDIGRSGRHVLDIVNDLLDISKIEAGEMELDFSAVTINECISEAVSIIQPQANSQRVIIRTSLSQSVPQIVADLRSIKQIALNILANAIRYTPSGGQVVVSTAYEQSGSVVLRIRDTGIGMSRSELEQAMKPFRQVTTGSRKRGDGTGLGLPLTKAMVEANRAIFSISSQPNEGTLVEITFPSQRVLAD